jgi:hypothetical protein
MPMRYSGDLKISITLLDNYDREGRAQYLCKIYALNGRSVLWSGTVGSPAWRSYADDSAEAYRKTAQAAISFALHERNENEAIDGHYPDYGENDYRITSRKG